MSSLSDIVKPLSFIYSNPSLVLPPGQKLYISDTNSYVIGDGVTPLINLKFIKNTFIANNSTDYELNSNSKVIQIANYYIPYNISGNNYLVCNNIGNFTNTGINLSGNIAVFSPMYIYRYFTINGIYVNISVTPPLGRQIRALIAIRTGYSSLNIINYTNPVNVPGAGLLYIPLNTPISLQEGIYFIGINVNNTVSILHSNQVSYMIQSNSFRPYSYATANIPFASIPPANITVTPSASNIIVVVLLNVTIN